MWVRKEEGSRKASGFLLLSRPHPPAGPRMLWLISGGAHLLVITSASPSTSALAEATEAKQEGKTYCGEDTREAG